MTRALFSLIQGDPARAFAFHPLIIVVVPLAVAGLIYWWGRRRRGWPPLSSRLTTTLVWVGAITFLAVWLLRWTSGTLPPV